MAAIPDPILRRIRGKGRGATFATKDFLDLGGRNATDLKLARLVKSGHILRVARGIYAFPRVSKVLGQPLAPDPDDVAQAIGRQTGSRVIPSGAVAANRLGLSTQVPTRLVYLTNGRSRSVKIGNQTLELRHAPPKELPVGGPMSATVIQALIYVGEPAIDDAVVSKLRTTLTVTQRRALRRDARFAVAWIADAARRIAQGD